jgi:hypothetical protein
MGKNWANQGLAAGLGAGALLLMGSAVAAPPENRAVQPRAQSQIRPLGQHLDLRAPDLRAPSLAVDVSDKASSFQSMSRRRSVVSQELVQLPAWGADGMRSRPGIQDFVRRLHCEGMPVARLFESKSALVHLGLSPKGKPGLWLVQKMH